MDCDHGIILDIAVASGEANDAASYLRQIEHIHQEIIPTRAAVADGAYDLPLFYRVLQDQGIQFYVRPLPRSAATPGGIPGSSFTYDEENDLYTCPGGKTLRLQNLNRSVGGLYWVYYAGRSDCAACSMRAQSVGKRTGQAPGTQLLPERNPGESEEAGQSNEPEGPGQAADLERRHLSAQKWGHRLGRLLRRDSEAAENHCLLSATAWNLKRMIKWTM